MRPSIGLLLVGHRDYQNDIGLRFATQAATALESHGIEVLFERTPLTEPLAAREAGIKLSGRDPDGVVVFLGTWIECPTALQAIREIEHLPFAIWGFNMFEWEGRRESTGSFVAAAVLKGALDRMDYRPAYILGLPSDVQAVERAAAFCRAAYAAKRLKRTRIALVGYAAMGMYGGTFDHVLLRRRIGPEVDHVDTYTLVRAAEAAPADSVAAIADELRTRADIAVEERRLSKAARLAAGLQAIINRGAFNAVNVKCQYELSQEYGMTACVPISLVAEMGTVASCEGDVLNTVTQCLLHYLRGETVWYGDILDLQGRRMLLSSCGFAPFSLCNPDETPRISELGHPGFDGIISSFTLKRGRLTYARLAEGRQGDYSLYFGTGTGVHTELRQGRFPAIEVELDGDPEDLLESLGSQHLALCYGDVTREIRDVCNWLGVTPNPI